MRAFRVEGRVQGVGFRAFAVRAGRGGGIRGAVRNEPDGAVRCVAEGADDALDRFAAALRQGPPAAQVTGVEVAVLERFPIGESFDAAF